MGKWKQEQWKSGHPEWINKKSKKKKCPHKNTRLINHSAIWHDGDIYCDDCEQIIGDFDAG